MPLPPLSPDRAIFFEINSQMSNPFFDWLMPIIRTPIVWAPLYVFIFCFFIYRYRLTGLYLVIALALTFAVSDQGSAHLLKGMVQRLRPCNDPLVAATVILRVPCGSGYSFPSAHASNHFAIAMFLSLILYKRWHWVAYASIFWAAAISFAQVYVGVHYPVDVLVGAIFGSLVGCLFAWLFKKFKPDFVA